MVKKLALLSVLTATLACSAEAPERTQLMLVAATDIERLDRIEFTVEGNGKDPQTADAVHGESAPGPHSLGLLYTGGELGPLTLTATGYAGDEVVVSRVARTFFVKGKTRVVPLHLMESCAGVKCADTTETCTERGCEPSELAPGALSDWEGTPPSYGDPGALPDGGGLDAGGSNQGGNGNGGGEGGMGSGNGAEDGGGMTLADGGMSDPDAGLTMCDGELTDLSSDPNHCGTCEKVCTVPGSDLHAVNPCVDGKCTPRCLEGWGTCDGVLANGCEQDVLQSNDHCGKCNVRCVGNRSCQAGVCVKN